jgi:hypothetical protein
MKRQSIQPSSQVVPCYTDHFQEIRVCLVGFRKNGILFLFLGSTVFFWLFSYSLSEKSFHTLNLSSFQNLAGF